MRTTVKYRPYTTKTRTAFLEGEVYGALESCERTGPINQQASDLGDGYTHFSFTAFGTIDAYDADHATIAMCVDVPSETAIEFPESYTRVEDDGTLDDDKTSPPHALWCSTDDVEFNFRMTGYQQTTTTRTYGKTKIIAKTYRVKVGNSGKMTYREYKRIKDGQSLSKVGKIVGGTGKVISGWSSGGHEYTIRSWQGHWINSTTAACTPRNGSNQNLARIRTGEGHNLGEGRRRYSRPAHTDRARKRQRTAALMEEER